MHVASWLTTYRGIVPDVVLAKLSVERREEAWASGLNNPARSQPVWVAEVDGRVVGFADSGPARDDNVPAGTMELYAIYLLQDCQRQGWGRQLWEKVLDTAQRVAAPGIVVWVLEDNHPARQFYERLGFALDGTTKMIPFETKPLPEVRYGLSLNPACP